MRKIELACIIDDDPIYIFGTKRMMQIADYCEQFLVFENGKEALNGLTAIISSDAKLPEVIFLDLNMPVMDGWDFLEEFEKIQIPTNIIIYILTSSIDPADTERAKQYSHVDSYLVKPLTLNKLKELMG